MAAVWVMIEWHDERIERVSDDAIQAPNIAPIILSPLRLDSDSITAKTARFPPPASDRVWASFPPLGAGGAVSAAF